MNDSTLLNINLADVNFSINKGIRDIYWLDELSREHCSIVGNKSSNLGSLINLGLQVPMGFSLSVKAYEHFMQYTGLNKKASFLFSDFYKKDLAFNEVQEKIIETSGLLINAIEKADIPSGLENSIRDFYKTLQEKVGITDLPCAVRSSGTVSMPGQLDTYLNISGEDNIIRHVKKVWGSVFSVRALHYRFSNNMDLSWMPIGVAIVEMFDAKSAGVIMTVLPATGDLDRAVIEGNFGLGESIVGGEVIPDSFIINKRNMTIESRSIPDKSYMTICSDSGTVNAKVPEAFCKKACINDNEILELVRISKEVEQHFGKPQDMEWVITKNAHFPDNIFWVQSRNAKYVQNRENDEDKYVIDLLTQIFKN